MRRLKKPSTSGCLPCRLITSNGLPAGGNKSLVCLAKCKTWTDEEFNSEITNWNVTFHPAEVEVLRPMIDGDGLIQLMQKRVPETRIRALHAKLDDNPA